MLAAYYLQERLLSILVLGHTYTYIRPILSDCTPLLVLPLFTFALFHPHHLPLPPQPPLGHYTCLFAHFLVSELRLVSFSTRLRQ